MRAAVCRAFGEPLSVEAVTLDPPGPHQVAVAVEACAICHSDIAYAAGAWGGALPAVYGHEAAGRVTAVGEGVRGVAAGERVLVTLIRACGGCPACAGGDPTSCAQAWDAAPSPLRDAAGARLAQGMATGAFAEAVVVDASQVVALPEDIPAAEACLLACGVITGVGAVINTARVRPGEAVAVIGAGGVGLNAIQGAALAGAGRIVAVDVSPAKLAAAEGFGATDAVQAGPEAAAAVRALTGGRGVDYAFVTVGAPAAIGEAAALLAAGGAVVVVGMPPSGSVVGYDPTTLAAMNQRILGSRMGRTVLARDVPWLIGHWRAGRLKLAELVTGRYRLEEINAAIAEARSGAARRNVILFGDRA
jgi:S-(hydroxymethyl)glutathione dehydrogenase/alcohol dehydrogenase